jgi:hypothetical protein
MLLANLIEDIMGRKSAAALHIFHALPDGLMHVGTSSYIKQALIRFRILYYSFRFTFNCKNNRALIFLKLLHKLSGVAAKSCHRLDVFRDVEHGRPSLLIAPFMVLSGGRRVIA